MNKTQQRETTMLQATVTNNEQTQAPNLHHLAKIALQECDGDTAKAAKRLLRKLKSNKALLAAITEQAVTEASKAFVSHKMRDYRAQVVHLAVNNTRDDVIALSRGIANSLLEFPLAGGKKLRDASSEEVAIQANRYEQIADDTGHKARWLRLVAQSVPHGKTVGESVSEERVNELFLEARKNG
jgi:hypothetical protein